MEVARPGAEEADDAPPVSAGPVVPAQATMSFDEVFVAHHDRLVRVVALMVGDRNDAEDVVADVFARTYRRWQRGPIDNIGAYLRAGAVNEVRSRWRKKAVRRRHDEHRERLVEEAASDDRIAEHARLRAALLELNERQRAAIVLRFFDDLSEQRTAEILGVAVGTVKSSVSRGLARLQEILGSSEGLLGDGGDDDG